MSWTEDYFIIVGISIYVVVFLVQISSAQEEQNGDFNDKHEWISRTVPRKLTLKDIGRSMLWPFILMWFLFWFTLEIICLCVCPILWVFSKKDYRDSPMHRFLERRMK